MKLFSINTGVNTEYVVAACEKQACDKVKNRGYMDIVEVEELSDVVGIEYAQYCEFHRNFMSGKYPNQRYGQAFLNVFDHNVLVKAFRYGGYIWEDNDAASVCDKLYSNDLIVL